MDKILGMHSNLFGLVALGGFLIGFMAMPLFHKSDNEENIRKKNKNSKKSYEMKEE